MKTARKSSVKERLDGKSAIVFDFPSAYKPEIHLRPEGRGHRLVIQVPTFPYPRDLHSLLERMELRPSQVAEVIEQVSELSVLNWITDHRSKELSEDEKDRV